MDADLYWLAGLLEGEGSFIGPAHGGNKIRVSIGMTDEDVIARVAALLGRDYAARPPREAHHKTNYLTSINGQQAAILMALLRPLMGERRRAAIDRALDAWTPPRTPQAHGLTAYKRGCRCQECAVAKRAEYDRAVARRS